MGGFNHSLLGCFDNCGICLLVYCCPFYVHGRNAESVGENCCICALILCFQPFGLLSIAYIRSLVRHSRNIDGNILCDLILSLICPCCVIIQSANELKDSKHSNRSSPSLQNSHQRQSPVLSPRAQAITEQP
ncbi:cell number regulator 10 [Biomphalaria pfeifferi]|uniref:Cell number regulator 10 n=1 Tax=Biomphalaria pfeifferi TaxID=112525 RepID=A0AAD8C008_BIOPF|nr:cell number regulator 10 [Biomphalaria pfeifferi]